MSVDSSNCPLLDQAIAGDRGALSRLLLELYDELYLHVRQRLTREPALATSAEDILQQVFVRSALTIGDFRPRGADSFRAWLWTIAGNLIRDVHKRQRRERRSGPERRHDVTDSAGADHPPAGGLDQLAADTTSPSLRVQRLDSVQRLHRAMEALPDEQREVIERYYLQYESLDQIARSMNRSKDAVRGICFRARQNLRGQMGHSSQFFSR